MKKFLKHMLDFIKWFLKCAIFGIITIFLFNFFGSYINLNIPVNIFTIIIIGVLRIPGLVVLLVYNIL